jgi:hypothetical protein
MEPNYEALERYHAALETFHDLTAKRHRLCGELCRMLAQSLERSDETLALFDHEDARVLLEDIIALNANLIQVIEHVNRHAAECGKPEIRLVYPKR